ncbi:MAG: hypothetical protein IKY21_03125, partial [Clostridia bacterium]|nr:hypothetical protein [Clostridia bacterium]
RSAIALLLVLVFFVGCTANEESISESASNETSEDTSITVSEVIEESSEVIINESSEPEAESSLEDKFAGIASFDTEFNEDKVHYYDGYMDYTGKETTFPPFMEIRFSTDTFAAFESAEDDDWFVVALSLPFGRETLEYAEFSQMLEHIGAIEIADHPFLGYKSFYNELTAAKTDAEKDTIRKARYEKMFPDAVYGNDPYFAGDPYTYIGYFTKPMLREADTASDTYILYTFMPEIGNNECWFKNLRKS